MKNQTIGLQNQFINLILLISSTLVYSLSALADANHTWAKSEAWTWMGHLTILKDGPDWELSSDGYAFIHYFTRNDTGMGRMNFKSSAVTRTQDGLGISYDKKTTFPNSSDKQFQLMVSEDHLEIEFRAPGQHDQIREIPLQLEDLSFLENKLLPLYPGLKIARGFEVKKYFFQATMGTNHQVDLTFFSIWPDIAPPDQRMKFFGLEDSYTFSSPMLVTYGTWRADQQPAKRVVGLSFLDRQWSKKSFSKNVFNDPSLFLKKHQALSWAHNWSAFHAYAPKTNDWYFVHLWRQVQRRDGQADQQADYTGIQWSKNGEEQPMINSSDFSWQPTKFIENQSKVLMNFAEGRAAFFPYHYRYQNPQLDSRLEIEASPKLQSLDQPIYLYEGYARGRGKWEGQEVLLQGRVESSQILFREADYRDILAHIDRSDRTQDQLADDLEIALTPERNPLNSIDDFRSHSKFLGNDLRRKFLIFQAQFQSKPKRSSDGFITYY